jgi:hypothetical protein
MKSKILNSKAGSSRSRPRPRLRCLLSPVPCLLSPLLFSLFSLLFSLFLFPPHARAADVQVRPDLVTAETEQAIQKGLAYLARSQARNGSWSGGDNYGGIYPAAMTSLGGLAMMAGGSTPCEGEYAENVRRAVYYVMSCANRNGLISVMDREQRPMYGHGFSMLFLAQAYGMEQDVELQRKIHDILVRAIALTARSQSAAGGWLYAPDQNGDEGSVTITQIQALRAARNAGVKVPKSTISRACEYIVKCAEPDGGICYSIGSRGSRPAITAAACAVMYNAGQYENPIALKALDYLKKHLRGGRSGTFGGHGEYELFYAAQAIFLSGAEEWATFYPKWRDDLIKRQNKDGSWEGQVGGVYVTSLCLIVLQLPYQVLPILQR